MFTLSEYLDGECTSNQWVNQHNPIALRIGETYVNRKGTWEETHYKVIHSDGYIAVTVVVYDAIHKKHGMTKEYDLFYVENGFRYNDMTRPYYRLTERIAE